MRKQITPEEYLDPEFDFEKCTKDQLRSIMFQNDISEIPLSSARKSEIVQRYRDTIYSQLPVLREKWANIVADGRDIDRFSDENIFQSGKSSRVGTPKKRPGNGKITLKMKVEKKTPRRVENMKRENRMYNPGDDVSDESKSSYGRGVEAVKNNDIALTTLSKQRSKNSSPFKESLDDDSSSENLLRFRKRNDSSLKKEDTIFTENLKTVENMSPKKKRMSDLRRTVKPPAYYKYMEKRRRWGFLIMSLLSLIVILYLRFWCPYCESGSSPWNLIKEPLNTGNYCIPIPENAIIRDGKIECRPGYLSSMWSVIKKSCIKDRNVEKEQSRKIKSILNSLRIRRAEFESGLRNSERVSVDEIDASEEIINIILSYGDVLIEDSSIYSVQPRYTIGIYLRYYMGHIIKFIILPIVGIILTIVMFRIQRYMSRRRREREREAESLALKVMNTLTSQVKIRRENPDVVPYVAINQLRDLFCKNNRVWRDVIEKVRENSNVAEYSALVRNKEEIVWEYVGPDIFAHIGISNAHDLQRFVSKKQQGGSNQE